MTEQKAIGPSFASEVAAARLDGLPFGWLEDGTLSFTDTKDYQWDETKKQAVLDVYAAHNPATPAPISNFSPQDKLKAFLSANPDVMALVAGG